MEKINIESLFQCRTHHSSNTLDVRSITHSRRPFDIDVLIETRERKRQKLLGYYTRNYDACLKKIEVANTLGKTDLLYSVRDYILNCPEYRAIDCVEYIREKLHAHHFNTYRVDDKTIFITWLYLETNLPSPAPAE